MPKITLEFIDENIKKMTEDLNSDDAKNDESYRSYLLLFIESLFFMREKLLQTNK